MKAVLVLLIALQLAICVTDNQRYIKGTFVEEEKQINLEDSSLGRMILKLITIKSRAQQFDFSKLFDALDQLKANIQESINDEQEGFQTSAVQYHTDSSYYFNQIHEYQDDVATHDIDIQDLQNTRISFEETLTQKQSELSEAQNLEKTVSARKAKNTAAFEAQIAEYNEAVDAIDQALELLTSARDGSFVELSKAQIVGAHLDKKLNGLQRRSLYPTLVQAFVNLSMKGFADSEALNKIIKLLQELRKNVDASRTSLTNSYQAENSSLQDTLDNYAEIISNLSNDVIPQLQADIQQKASEVVSKQQLLRDAQANLDAAQNNAKNTEDRWIVRQKQNTDLIQEFRDQLAIIAQAETQLQRSGIRRQ